MKNARHAVELVGRGDLPGAVKALAGAKLPVGLEVFFPATDGRQDLMYEQDFGLERHRPAFLAARKAVLAADLPALDRQLLAGYLDLFLGEYARATASLARVAAARPGSYWPNFLHAAAIWLLGDERRTRDLLPEALQAVEKAVKADPKAMYPYVVRAGIRRELEDVPGRLADADRVLKMDPRFVWARTERLEVLGETGHYKAALKEANHLIKRFPDQAWSWAQRGRLRGISGYYELALADFEKAESLDPSCGPLVAWKAEAMRRLGRYPEALAELTRAIKLDPGYRLAHEWRGRVHLLLGDYKKAVADFDRTLKVESREMLARAWRGEAWWKAGDAAKAAADYEEVFPAQPGALWNARLKGSQTQEAYFMLDSVGGKRVKAFREDLDAGVKAAPRDPWALAFRGRCLVDDSRAQEGLKDLDAALKLDPDNGYALSWRGEALRRLGRRDEAIASLDLAAVKAKGVTARWAWARLGRCLAEAGRHEEAVVAFDHAVATRDQRFALAHVWRAESLWALGRMEQSREAYRTAFVLDGKCHEAEDGLKRFGGRRALALAA
ncbi:MAG: tetratricopeptide repeat protein [Elusimicrobiota bacterium]|nr:tetratricopeptide repeat protein [Elusimicrobiota bacterium]